MNSTANRLRCVVVVLLATAAFAQSPSGNDTLIQQGKVQLQAGHADQALAAGEQAIKLDPKSWEGYALAGGALMNLKRYDEAITQFSDAIERAPQDKQAGLSELRKRCFAAESGTPPSASPTPAANSTAPEATTTQAEVVLWKSIEDSTNPEDFQAYLSQYPHGAFFVLAQRHLSDIRAQAALDKKMHGAELVGTIWAGLGIPPHDSTKTYIVFSSPTQYWTILDENVRGSDAYSMAFNAFAERYNCAQCRRYGGVWNANGASISLISDPNVNCNGQQYHLSGTRTTDSMQGTVSAAATHGFFGGCGADQGNWQIHLINKGGGSTDGSGK